VHTDKNTESANGDEALGFSEADAGESSEESTLRWLLDMDMSEPEEKLFTVDLDEQSNGELTGYDLDVASRPMIRGSAGADDLENYIDEEIVISSDDLAGDIYSGSPSGPNGKSQSEAPAAEENMAIDFSRSSDARWASVSASVAEGLDILGLDDNDDIGEKFLVLKRNKPADMEAHKRPADPVQEDTAVAAGGEAGSTHQQQAVSRPDEIPQLRLVSAAEEAPAASKSPAAPEEAAAPPAEAIVGFLSDPAATAEQSEPGQAAEDVFGYIASVPAPADEDAFDDFLVQGEQLSPGEVNFDGLCLESDEQDEELDLWSDGDIDYHQDFTELEGFEGHPATSVAAHIPQFMQDVAAAVDTRLQQLALEPGCVQAQLEVATDDAHAQQLVLAGYGPALEICGATPHVFQNLNQPEMGTLYLRLLHQESGNYWNRMLDDDFAVPAGDHAPDELAAAGADQQDFASELEAFDMLGEELGAASEVEVPESDTWQPGEQELEDIFGDLDGDLLSAPQVNADTGEYLTAPEGEAGATDEVMQVFSEDIFAEDISLELGSEVVEEQTDIDAVFDKLHQVVSDGDDICGLEVEEFSVAGEDIAETAPEADQSPEPVPAVAQVGAQDVPWYIPAGVVFAQSSPSSGEIFPDFLDAFIEEGSSELEKLEDAVAAWERECASEPAYTAVTRILHTIKGIAKGVGLHCYGTLIHNFETLLSAVPRPDAEGETEYFRLVNAWLDAAVRGLDHIRDSRSDIANTLPQPASAALGAAASPDAIAAERELETAIAEPAPEPVVAPQVEAPSKALNDREKQQAKKLADEGARALAAQQSVRITSEKLDQLLNLTNQAQQLGVRTAQGTARSKRSAAEMLGRLSSVRAHIASIADRALRSVTAQGGKPGNRMDALEMDQYSELQEAANILREGVEDLADLVEFASRQNVQVEALLKQQANVISSIGSAIRAARVVPVSRLVPGLRRLVRTVSVDLGKTVSFQVENELGTLDRDDYARCQTILEHMMRNALDHGIESEQERIEAGKSSTGQVTIDISKAGADTIITLSDDGRGIDPETMRESALRKGLDIDVDALTDEEAQRLIFHKGFSTANTVSQISGRGVGMDIVLSELQEMGGDIRIESEVGKGTSFVIRVPSSITVNGALMVRAAEHTYAIPLGGLVAVEQVAVADFLAAVDGEHKLTLAGRECEPAYLGTLCQTVKFPDAKTWRHSVPVIIAGSDDRYMAIAVDDFEEVLEMVIRSLGAQFSTVPGVAGAATTAAGEAIVALDLNMLVASVGDYDHSTLHVEEDSEEALLALVVDDSRTQRMVATSQLETVGVETITAENGSVAIDLLNTCDRLPDIILMDVEMPVKDGIQTLREIRKSIRYSDIPVIMITSRTGLKHRALAEAAGCNGYMGKPFNFRMLVGQINELTGDRLQLS
jgi:chemosensory pili system protein ChpA (sensor histidine kinase/response regulator)